MATEWIAPLSALAGAVIGGGASLFGSALTAHRASADKRTELRLQLVADSRELVLDEARTLIGAFDEFIQVLKKADAISAAQEAAIKDDQRAEELDRIMNPERPSLSMGDSPRFRSRPEFDHAFREWSKEVEAAVPSLRSAVSSVEIAVPEVLWKHAQAFLRRADLLVTSFRPHGVIAGKTNAVDFEADRQTLVSEIRTWLLLDLS